ncbi:CHASE2 and HATPase_c domain-containing protein [Paraburkholderia sediminicola]|uniref:CHASE2 domain-containing protein n=1 Tax=Paraburkholderia sediminicola TaxID=458836 RepID=UPI0038BB79A4
MRRRLSDFGLRRRKSVNELGPCVKPRPNLAWEWVGLTVTLMLFCLILTCTQVLRRADLAFLDAAAPFVHRTTPRKIVVIAIDDRTVGSLGGWPLGLQLHAQLIDRLTQSGVAAIGFDVVTAHATHATDEEVKAFAAAIKLNGKVVTRLSREQAPGKSMAYLSDPTIAAASYASGHIGVHVDHDGVVRSFYMLAGGAQSNRHIASLVLRAAGMNSVDCSEAERAAAAANGTGCLRYVPLGRERSYETYSYVDVLHGKVPADRLEGRIVLVGATADDAGRRLATPVVDSAPLNGVEFLAEITNAMATSTLSRRVSFWHALLFNESAVPLICLCLYLLGPRASLVVSISIAAAIAACSYVMLWTWHLILPSAPAILICIIAYPLLAWRRQEALLNYLSFESARVVQEPSFPEASGARRFFIDPIQHRLSATAALVGRVRRYQKFVSKWVDSLPEATLVTSPAGIIILANERVCALCEDSEVKRAESSSPAGRPVTDVLFEITESHRAIEFATQALSLLDVWSNVTDFPACSLLLAAQGIEISNARGGRSLLIKCAPIRPSYGQEGAMIFHVADVSSVRKAERQRDMALRFLSHDMRSPQAAILALIDQMRRDPLRFTAQRFTELVEQYATASLRLSDDFLFLAKAETLPPKLAPVDPALVLGDAIDDLWTEASTKSTTINLTAEPGKSTIADVQLLRRAFGNLISNAIKYSPQSSTVNVQLAETDRHLKISVCDQGVGISEREKQKLFREFSQLDVKSPRSGHGLGLAFVKTVIDSLGGKLQVQSTPGEGATFIVFLPKVGID